jgi:pimeloyl-ACP methyl ester carboxylesterase
MTRSTRRRFGGLVGKLLFTCAALLIAWLVLRPPLIDIGGARLETRLKGSGSPTVVFETGFTGGILPYWKLQDRIAEHTRTLFYERAGLGRSDAGRQPRTAEQMARDLHSLLIAAGVTPPIILVGHSAGGIFMRVFAHDYPNDVAAMVFVDPATEASYERMRRASPEEWREMDKKLPEGQRRQWDALPASLDEARSAWPLPQIPYVVITAAQVTRGYGGLVSGASGSSGTASGRNDHPYHPAAGGPFQRIEGAGCDEGDSERRRPGAHPTLKQPLLGEVCHRKAMTSAAVTARSAAARYR